MKGYRQAVLLLFAGIVAFGLFMLAEMPGRALAPYLGATPPLHIGALRGTLASGRADSLRMHGRPLGALHWRWNPLYLLTGRLGLALRTAHQDLAADGTVVLPLLGSGPVSAGGLSIDLDAGLVGLPVQGRLRGFLDRVSWDEDELQAAGDLAWHDAASELLPGVKLGIVGATVEGDTARITTRGDGMDIKVSGELKLLKARVRYQFDLAPVTARGRQSMAGLSGFGRALPGGGLRVQGEWRMAP